MIFHARISVLMLVAALIGCSRMQPEPFDNIENQQSAQHDEDIVSGSRHAQTRREPHEKSQDYSSGHSNGIPSDQHKYYVATWYEPEVTLFFDGEKLYARYSSSRRGYDKNAEYYTVTITERLRDILHQCIITEGNAVPPFLPGGGLPTGESVVFVVSVHSNNGVQEAIRWHTAASTIFADIRQLKEIVPLLSVRTLSVPVFANELKNSAGNPFIFSE